MSQAPTWSVPLSAPAPKSTYSAQLDDSLNALLSLHSGASRPSYAVKGTMWVREVSTSEHIVMLYDGVADHPVGPRFNPVTGQLLQNFWRTVHLANATHTFRTWATRFDVQVVGGGGGGGSADTDATNEAAAAPGGAAGGFTTKLMLRPASLTTATVTVGAGGAGGVAGGSQPGAGGDSTYSDGSILMTGFGGAAANNIYSGATLASVNSEGTAVPLGGYGTGGDFSRRGDPGGFSVALGGSVATLWHAQGGHGAASPLGGGAGRGGFVRGSTSGAASGSDGEAPGAGGGGAASIGNTAPGAAGGDGADGRVIITEYL